MPNERATPRGVDRRVPSAATPQVPDAARREGGLGKARRAARSAVVGVPARAGGGRDVKGAERHARRACGEVPASRRARPRAAAPTGRNSAGHAPAWRWGGSVILASVPHSGAGESGNTAAWPVARHRIALSGRDPSVIWRPAPLRARGVCPCSDAPVARERFCVRRRGRRARRRSALPRAPERGQVVTHRRPPINPDEPVVASRSRGRGRKPSGVRHRARAVADRRRRRPPPRGRCAPPAGTSPTDAQFRLRSGARTGQHHHPKPRSRERIVRAESSDPRTLDATRRAARQLPG